MPDFFENIDSLQFNYRVNHRYVKQLHLYIAICDVCETICGFYHNIFNNLCEFYHLNKCENGSIWVVSSVFRTGGAYGTGFESLRAKQLVVEFTSIDFHLSH